MRPLNPSLAGLVAAVLMIASFVEPVTRGEELLLIGGRAENATFDRLADDGRVIFRQAPTRFPVGSEPGRRNRLETTDQSLVRFGFPQPAVTQPMVHLVDGTTVAGDILALTGRTVSLENRLFERRELDLGLVAGVDWSQSILPAVHAEVAAEIATPRDSEDRLLRLGGGELLGTVLGTPSDADLARPGTATARRPPQAADRPITALAFRPAVGEDSTIAVSALRAWTTPRLLQREVGSDAKVRWRIGLMDGSNLAVASWSVAGRDVTLRLACGLSWTVDQVFLRDEVVYLIPVRGAALWADTLPPQAYRHIPLTTAMFPLGVRQSVAGGPLMLGGRIYARGFGLHSRSRVLLALPAGRTRLRGRVGLDDSTGGGGSINAQVFVRRAGTLVPAWSSSTLRGTESPIEVDADVTEADAVVLIVEEADGGDLLDRSAWVDLRFEP